MNLGLTLEKAWKITLKKWSTPGSLYYFTDALNCGLCQKFRDTSKCTGCPIARVTKKPFCKRFTGFTRMMRLMGRTVNNIPVSYSEIEAVRKHGLEKLIQIKAKSELLSDKKFYSKPENI